VEPEVSLPYSQEFTAGAHFKPYESSAQLTPCCCNIHSNVILPYRPTSESRMRSLSLRFSDQNFIPILGRPRLSTLAHAGATGWLISCSYYEGSNIFLTIRNVGYWAGCQIWLTFMKFWQRFFVVLLSPTVRMRIIVSK